VVSGKLSDGYISVDAYDSSKVWILLDGVEINCSDNACIRVDQADKVFLTLAEGSQNILTGGSAYSDEALSDGTDGTVYAHDDLTINGSGSLTVNSQYEHGISANDDLVITGGAITVTAPSDAIRANDSIRICGARITAEGGDDGIVTTNAVENGYLYVESGTLKITAGGDGIHTTGDIETAGGDITISAGDDGVHGAVHNGGNQGIPIQLHDFQLPAVGFTELLGHHDIVAVGVAAGGVDDGNGTVAVIGLGPVVGSVATLHGDGQHTVLHTGESSFLTGSSGSSIRGGCRLCGAGRQAQQHHSCQQHC
jgi:hypothetical protein